MSLSKKSVMYMSGLFKSQRLLIFPRLQRSNSRSTYASVKNLNVKFKRSHALSIGVSCSLAFAAAVGLVYSGKEETSADDKEDKENQRVTESESPWCKKTSKSSCISYAIHKSLLQLEQTKEETGSPGIICAVSIDGEVVWKRALGFSDVENGAKCTTDTLMRIASISKALTSIAVAKLWQERKVNLDAPIQEYVDYFPVKEFDNKIVTMTTRQLMSHTSGLRHYEKVLKDEKGNDSMINDSSSKETKNQSEKNVNSKSSDAEIFEKEYYIKENYKTIKEAIKIFQDDPLLKKPGTDYLYSTHAWTLISAVIEKAGAMDYVKFMKKMCYELGLDNTMVELNDPLIYNRSRNYTRDTKGKLLNCPYVDNSYKWAGGGYLSSIGDLVKIGNIMMYCYQNKNTDNEKESYLSKNTVDQLWTPVPITTGKVSKKFKDMGYGLGWTISPEVSRFGCCRNTKFAAMHTGSAVGASSILLITPQQTDEKTKENGARISNDVPCDASRDAGKPRGVVVAIMVNMQGVSLTELAFKIAENFNSC